MGRLGGLDLLALPVRMDCHMHTVLRGSLVLDSIALLGSSRAPTVADLGQ